jgi:predicted DNA-binding transcriptional regulator YafY
VRARDVTESEAKFFRIDRMLEATVGDTAFDPPDDAEGIPEWFDLSANLRTLRIRVAARALERLPSPHRIEPVAEPATVEADVVEVDVIVSGDRHRDHVLLSLPPEAEVLAPPEAVEHRRALAARMLAAYE